LVWASFWYNYAVGGLIFVIGLLYAHRQGEVGFKTRRARRNLFMLVGGLALIFGMQLALMLSGRAN
jgi:hypothetical protein